VVSTWSMRASIGGQGSPGLVEERILTVDVAVLDGAPYGVDHVPEARPFGDFLRGDRLRLGVRERGHEEDAVLLGVVEPELDVGLPAAADLVDGVGGARRRFG
jgi:hypothetical protein